MGLSIDIGIMPLPDTLWTRGKCGYKMLQYGACGVPFVGSPVGANQEIISRLGQVSATTSDDWLDRLLDLIGLQESARRERGVAARRGVQDSYSYSAWQERWEDAVLDQRHPPEVELRRDQSDPRPPVG